LSELLGQFLLVCYLTLESYQIAQLVTKTANGFIRQDHKFFMNALYQTFVAATGKIGPADTKIEQSVTAKDYSMP